MFGIARKYALVAVLVAGAAIVASKLGDWSRVRAPALIDLAVPAKRPVTAAPEATGRETSAPALPALDLDHLRARGGARAPSGDLFDSRSWIAPKEKPREVIAVQAAPPPAPPLPFTYLGKWTERDRVAVVLSKEGRSYVAHANDILDGAYRVDRIEPTRVTMTFLPLGAQQTLEFGPSPQADAAKGGAAATLANPDAILHLIMPDQAALADEFTILLSLDPVRAALIARGSIELSYDPLVLNVVAAGTTRIPMTRNDPGRIAVELGGGYVGHGGPAAAVRLRVVADAPTTTQLRVATLVATDLEEHSLAVAIDGPNPRPFAIVAGAKTK